MEGEESGAQRGAGQECPAPKTQSVDEEAKEISVGAGEGLKCVPVTEEEWEAIHQFKASPGGACAGGGRVKAMAWAALKLAGMLLLGGGIEVGFSDGNELDEVGCTVTVQPRRTGHGVHSGQAGEDAGGKPGRPGSGSSGGSGDGGPDSRPECEMRAMMCAHRLPDGQCRRSKRQCRLFVGAAELDEMVARIFREIAAWRGDYVELRSAKERLEKMLADGLFKFATHVDATSFKVVCTVLAEGDVAKASRTLAMRDSSVRTLMRRWRSKGKEYRAMLDLVRWRKAVGPKETVTLSDNVLLERAEKTDYPGLLADVLEKVTEMTGENWREKAEELEEMLRAVAEG